MPISNQGILLRRILSCGLLLMTLASASTFLGKDNSPADLSLRDLDGKRVHLRDLRGKIIVLNFWATWCEPCRDEMPRLVEAEKNYKQAGIVFVGASLDDAKTKEKIPEFIQNHQIDFPIWVGATADDLDRLEMGPAVPATAFIDSEGHIIARVSGEIRPEELKERLDWLAGDHSSPAPKARVVHLEEHK